MFVSLDCLFYYGTLYERFEQALLCNSFSTIVVYFKERAPRPTIYYLLYLGPQRFSAAISQKENRCIFTVFFLITKEFYF